MQKKEILVIGAGIAGCAVALALAKRGISVTLLTSPLDRRIYHSPFIHHDNLEEKVKNLRLERQEHGVCSRAFEQLVLLGRKSIDELLESNYLVDRYGNVDIHRCLQEQLKEQSNVEWLTQHSVIELITLDQHSQKKGDRYKQPACLGVIAFNHDTQKVEHYLAKETILATGGAASLFPYSTHSSTACGGGIAIAYRAGARIINMDQIQFYPLGLFQRDLPSFPLPFELLSEGAKLYGCTYTPLQLDDSSPILFLHQFYNQLLKTHTEHLWLDLSSISDLQKIKEKYATMDIYCLNYGLNIVKDLLPVVPTTAYTCGGIAVDRYAQTTLHRLRAIGEVSCTGLFWNYKEEALSVLESLTWALSCADDIAKLIDKFIYYFPDIRVGLSHLAPSSSIIEEDWKILRQIMWSYVGILHDSPRLERASALLEQLSLSNSSNFAALSIDQIQLFHAILTAQIITNSLRNSYGSLPTLNYASFFLKSDPLSAHSI